MSLAGRTALFSLFFLFTCIDSSVADCAQREMGWWTDLQASARGVLGLHTPIETSQSDDHLCTIGEDPLLKPLPANRTTFTGAGGGTLIMGWPSTGGLWVTHAGGAVELDFLNLSRFETSPSQRYSDAEDAFCQRMEYIGATFYQSEYQYNEEDYGFVDNRRSTLWYGWPGVIPNDGVWALRSDAKNGYALGVSRIKNAVTMQERCQVIENLGGKFYADWKDAPKVESSKESDVDQGGRVGADMVQEPIISEKSFP